jgi:hypothetical protein
MHLNLLIELEITNLKNKLSQTKTDLEMARAKLSTLLSGERPQQVATELIFSQSLMPYIGMIMTLGYYACKLG